jgi:hypothetical protein
MRSCSKLRLVALLGPLAVVTSSLADGPAGVSPDVERVLRYVPDETKLLVVAPEISRFVKGVNAFGEAIGMRRMARFEARHVFVDSECLRARLLDLDGPFVVAVSTRGAEPVLVTTIVEADRSDWKPAEVSVALPAGMQVYDLGDEGFAAVSGDLAVLSRQADELQRAIGSSGAFGRRFAAAHAEQLAKRDLVVHADLPAWRDFMEQRLELFAQGAYMGMAGAPSPEAALQLWTWAVEQIRKMMAEALTYTVAANLSAEGAFLEDRIRLRSDGDVARYLRSVRKPERDIFRGLPAGRSAFVFAQEWELPEDVTGINESLVKVMLRQGAMATKGEGEAFERALQRSLAAYRKISGTSGVFMQSECGKGLVYYGMYLTSDGEAVREDVRAVCELCPEMMDVWGPCSGQRPTVAQERFGTLTADVYRFSNGDTESPAAAMFDPIYGKGAALHMATVPGGVFYVFGQAPTARSVLQRQASSSSSPLSSDPRVVALKKRLSAHPQLCVLVDLPQTIDLVTTMVRAMGAPMPTMSMPDAPMPLAGAAFYLQPDGVRTEAWVPAPPLHALLDAMEKVQARAQE